MHPKDTMQRVIDGKRYNVRTATLLASNEYWDGSNFDREGRNAFLYRTRGGAYFEVNLTKWSGERDTLIPLTRAEAQELYENLPEHLVDYETAFDAVVEEAASGRPSYYGQPMRQTAIWLPDDMIAWLKSQDGGMGETIRSLIKGVMGK